MPTDRPPKIPGRAPGSTTENSTRARPPPRVSTASSHTGSRARTACRVDTSTGKRAAAQVMKTMPCSLVGSSRIATGTRAMAGIGRTTSTSGPRMSAVHRDRATAVPAATPRTAARRNPTAIRRRLCPRSCQYASVPIRSARAEATSTTVGNCSNRSHRSTSRDVSTCQSPRAASGEAIRTRRRPHGSGARLTTTGGPDGSRTAFRARDTGLTAFRAHDAGLTASRAHDASRTASGYGTIREPHAPGHVPLGARPGHEGPPVATVRDPHRPVREPQRPRHRVRHVGGPYGGPLDGLEESGGAVEGTGRALTLQPQLGPRGARLRVGGVRHRPAQRRRVDEGVHVDVLDQTRLLEDRHVLLERCDQLRAERRVEGGDALGAVVEVDHLGGQPGLLRDRLGGGHRPRAQVVGRPVLRAEEGVEDGGSSPGELLPDGDPVEGRQVQLGAVVQGLGLALEGEQTGPGDELGQRVDTSGRQGRSPHARLLVELADILRGVDPGPPQRPYEGAVGGRTDTGGHLAALQVRERPQRRTGFGDHGVEAPVQVVTGDRDEPCRLLELFSPRRVDQQREVAHRADVDLPRRHLCRDRGPGRVVLPDHPVGDAVLPAPGGEFLLEVAEGAQQGSGGHGVDGLRLVADRHRDRLPVGRASGVGPAGGGEGQEEREGEGESPGPPVVEQRKSSSEHGSSAFHRSR